MSGKDRSPLATKPKPQKKPPKRGFLIGYYGFGNAGDDILLSKTTQIIKQKYPHISLCVLYKYKEWIQAATKIDPLKFPPYKNSKIFGELTFAKRHSLQVMGAFFRAQIIVFGGGTLFQDRTSTASLLYYLSFIFWGMIFRKKMVLLGQGVGSFKGRKTNWLVKFCINRCVAVSLRDEASLNVAKKQLNIQNDKLTLASDLAYFNTSATTSKVTPEGLISLSLRPCSAFKKTKKELIKGLHQLDQPFIFLECQHGDDFTCIKKEVERKPSSKGPSPIAIDEIWYLNHYFYEHNIENQPVYMVVGMRYHSLVWASLHHLPFIGLGYDEKVKQLCTELGQEYIDLHPASFTDKQLTQTVEKIKKNYKKYQKALISKTKIQQERSKNHLCILP